MRPIIGSLSLARQQASTASEWWAVPKAQRQAKPGDEGTVSASPTEEEEEKEPKKARRPL